MKKSGFPFTLICDQDRTILHLYAIDRVSPFGYFHPGVVRLAREAKRRGFIHGNRDGEEFQRPAFFLLDRNMRIRLAYYGKHIGDLPEWEFIKQSLEKMIKGQENP